MGMHPRPPKDNLAINYEKMNMIDLAKKYNDSRGTIRRWLKHYDIPFHSNSECQKISPNKVSRETPKPTKEVLVNDYAHMSIKKLAKKYKTHKENIKKWLKSYEVNLRTVSECQSLVLKRKKNTIFFLIGIKKI